MRLPRASVAAAQDHGKDGVVAAGERRQAHREPHGRGRSDPSAIEERRPLAAHAEHEPYGNRHRHIVREVQVLEAEKVIRQPAEDNRTCDSQRRRYLQFAAEHDQRGPDGSEGSPEKLMPGVNAICR